MLFLTTAFLPWLTEKTQSPEPCAQSANCTESEMSLRCHFIRARLLYLELCASCSALCWGSWRCTGRLESLCRRGTFQPEKPYELCLLSHRTPYTSTLVPPQIGRTKGRVRLGALPLVLNCHDERYYNPGYVVLPSNELHYTYGRCTKFNIKPQFITLFAPFTASLALPAALQNKKLREEVPD